MDDILRQCHVHEITHVWPLSTEDQLIMALESSTLLRDHVVIASPVDVVEIANDKIRLYERCAARGVARPGVPDHRRRRGSATRRRRARASEEARRAQGDALGTGAAGLKIIGLSVAAGSNLPGVALAPAAGKDTSLSPPRIGTRMIRYFPGTVLPA